jgi:hypothetical protein
MVKKHILILNWQFPPNKGIGGRRCAKLAQEWKTMGHDISIISHQQEGDLKSSNLWIDADTLQSFDHHFIRDTNQFNALYFKSGWFNAIHLQLGKIWHRLFTKGNPIDDARFAEKTIIKTLEKVHQKKNIDLLFVSSAPFSLSLYACMFKKQHPTMKVWCDFRDPWKNAINYGLQLLSKRQLKDENQFQTYVAQTADYLSAPYVEILGEFNDEFASTKKVLIPHFTDRKISASTASSYKSAPLLTYAGNWYEGSMIYFKNTFEQLNLLPEGEKPTIGFIGHFEEQLQSELKLMYDKINFQPWMASGLDDALMKSDGIIILLSDHNRDFHTTKFYDYLPFGKPYFYVGPMGKVAETIQEKQLGCLLYQYHPRFWNQFESKNAHLLLKEFSAKKMATKIIEHAFTR